MLIATELSFELPTIRVARDARHDALPCGRASGASSWPVQGVARLSVTAIRCSSVLGSCASIVLARPSAARLAQLVERATSAAHRHRRDPDEVLVATSEADVESRAVEQPEELSAA